MKTFIGGLFYRMLVLSLLASGCKKDEALPKITSTVCFPNTIITPDAMFDLEFNSGNKIGQIIKQVPPYFYSTIFKYDSDGKNIISASFLKTGTLFSGLGGTVSSGSYGYDLKGNLTRRDSTIGTTVYVTIFGYNSDNQLTSSTTTVRYGGIEYLVSSRTFEYSNASTKNPSKSSDLSGAANTYEYDKQTNPAKLLGFPSVVPDNNVIKKTYSKGDSSVVTLYIYEYNSNGSPTAMSSGTDNTRWFYDCILISK